MEFLSSPEAWLSLITLTVLEIVLGIDNIVFISILVGKLPESQQKSARQTGLILAMVMRILLLLSLNYIMRLTSPIFNIGSIIGVTDPVWLEKLAISGRDLILLIGGIFLLYKSVHEIHQRLEGEDESTGAKPKAHSFSGVLIQIMLLDIVFSLDSVITAVGMAEHLEVMIAAVVISVIIMMISAKGIGNFVNKHPTVKMLALSFLMLIGVSLLAEALDQHIPKGYIYFAMAFSVLVEMLNLKSAKKSPVQNHV